MIDGCQADYPIIFYAPHNFSRRVLSVPYITNIPQPLQSGHPRDQLSNRPPAASSEKTDLQQSSQSFSREDTFRCCSGQAFSVETPDALHQKKVPTLVNCLTLRKRVIAFKSPCFPREYLVEGFFSLDAACFGVNYFAIPETYRSFFGPAPHIHPTTVSAYAEELNHIGKARVGDRSAKPRRGCFINVVHLVRTTYSAKFEGRPCADKPSSAGVGTPVQKPCLVIRSFQERSNGTVHTTSAVRSMHFLTAHTISVSCNKINSGMTIERTLTRKGCVSGQFEPSRSRVTSKLHQQKKPQGNKTGLDPTRFLYYLRLLPLRTRCNATPV